MIEYFKKDKLKASVIIASIFLFIVGIIVTAINSGGTYAYEYGDSVGSVCPIGGTIEYNKSYGDYCSLTIVEEPSTFVSGTDLSDEYTCKQHLSQLGKTYVSTSGNDCGYSPVGITVYFDTDGGNPISSKRVASGNTITLPTPYKDDHVFQYWFNPIDGKINAGDTVTPPTSDSITYKAYWKAVQTSQVEFHNTMDGSIFAIRVVSKDDSPLTIDLSDPDLIPFREGYTLLKWHDVNNGIYYNTNDTINISYTSPVLTLETVWGHTITYDTNGGNTISDRKYEIGETYKLPTPSRENHVFKCWVDANNQNAGCVGYANDTKTANKSMTYLAVWEACYVCESSGSYIWSVEGEITSSCSNGFWQVVSGVTSASKCKAPSSGGDTPVTPTPKTYTIKYDANGGSSTPADQTKTEGVALTLAGAITREGFEFVGWMDSNGDTYGAGGSYTIDASTTMTAQWKEVGGGDTPVTPTPSTYVVKYNANGGSTTPAEQTKTEGNALTLAGAITREGFEFDGWKASDGTIYGAAASYTKDESTTMTAQWKAKSYSVIYNGNSGTYNGNVNYTDPNKAVFGQSYTAMSNQFVKKGYHFVTWNEKDDGTGTERKASSSWIWNIDDGLTLYAIWNPNIYNITYENASVTGNPENAKYDETVTIENPTKNVNVHFNDNKNNAVIEKTDIKVDFEFTGWTSDDVDFTTARYGEKENIWNNKDKLITDTLFKNLTPVNNGTVTLVANWNDETITLPNVTKEGYTCEWNTEADGKGTGYAVGSKYKVSSDSKSENLYAICVANSVEDDEIEKGPTTGDALIYVVWVIGAGALGYSVYYFMKKRNNL